MFKERVISFGIVDGGLDSFIGNIHRKAAELDGSLKLVCGVFF